MGRKALRGWCVGRVVAGKSRDGPRRHFCVPGRAYETTLSNVGDRNAWHRPHLGLKSTSISSSSWERKGTGLQPGWRHRTSCPASKSLRWFLVPRKDWEENNSTYLPTLRLLYSVSHLFTDSPTFLVALSLARQEGLDIGVLTEISASEFPNCPQVPPPQFSGMRCFRWGITAESRETLQRFKNKARFSIY